MKELLKPSDVAPLLGVSRNRVYQLIQEGVLPAVRMGGSVRIPRAAWERWLAGQAEQAEHTVRDLAGDGQWVLINSGRWIVGSRQWEEADGQSPEEGGE